MKKFLKALWDKPERMVAIAAIIATVFIVYEIRDRGKELRIRSKNTAIQTKIYSTQVFSRAIEQLGSEQEIIQLGAVHSLERLAEDSDEYYWPIMQVLTSCCKEYDINNISKIPSRYIQEILNVFKRRKYYYGVGEEKEKIFDLSSVGLRNQNLREVNLSNANLQAAYLKEAHLWGANLVKANLKEAILERANLVKANLKEAILEGANLKGANLEEANLDKANLKEAHLWGANLVKANLKEAILEGANLRGANLEGANLEEADLWKANLQEAHLWGANLVKANLKEAILEGASFRGANLKEANLWGANLKEAHLWGANLRGANLRGANLEGAWLIEANLEEVINLTIEQLSKVKTLYNVKNLDPELMKQVKEGYPHLLEDPMK